MSVAEFLGGGCQSVFVSHLHQAVIVSMGDFGFVCEPIWENFRQAIVSAAAGLNLKTDGWSSSSFDAPGSPATMGFHSSSRQYTIQ